MAFQQVLVTIAVTIALLTTVVSGFTYCPMGCSCDDEKLTVECEQGYLDVLPIALNPSVQRLSIKQNKIKTIDSSIQFYSELKYLDLSTNNLLEIPQRTFAYQKKLQELHMDSNKIGSVNSKTFVGLTSLTVLSLRGNFIEDINENVFSPLVKLEELNLSGNRIRDIHPNAFNGLLNLRILYLEDNTLTQIPSMVFSSVPSLAELFIGMNSFNKIPTGSFKDLKGLSRLSVRGCNLNSISNEGFKGLDGLRTLDLSDNLLEKIPTVVLSSLHRLEELHLGQNPFESVPDKSFVGMKNLKYLEISGSFNLNRIEEGAFSANTNLESISISANKKLTKIHPTAFRGLPHLKEVNLRDNALTTLNENMLAWSELKKLDLSENPIACDCKMLWLRNIMSAKKTGWPKVACASPRKYQETTLENLRIDQLGCDNGYVQEQALIALIVVGSIATITAMVLFAYRYRSKLIAYLSKKSQTNDYEQTFSDESFISIQPQTYFTMQQQQQQQYQYQLQQQYKQQQFSTLTKHQKPQPQSKVMVNQNYYSPTLHHHHHHLHQQGFVYSPTVISGNESEAYYSRPIYQMSGNGVVSPAPVMNTRPLPPPPLPPAREKTSCEIVELVGSSSSPSSL
ncbi:hypothetical protein ACFFRR_010173 [Megaselia abdita]